MTCISLALKIHFNLKLLNSNVGPEARPPVLQLATYSESPLAESFNHSEKTNAIQKSYRTYKLSDKYEVKSQVYENSFQSSRRGFILRKRHMLG